MNATQETERFWLEAAAEWDREARVVRLIARTRLCILGWSPEDADRAISPDVDGNHFLITGTLPLVRARMLDDGRAAGKR